MIAIFYSVWYKNIHRNYTTKMCDSEGYSCFMKIFYGNGLRGTLAATDKCLFCTEFTECDKTQYEYSLTSTKIDDDGRWCGKVFFRLPASLFHSDRIFFANHRKSYKPTQVGCDRTQFVTRTVTPRWLLQ